MHDLFSDIDTPKLERISLPDAELYLVKHWLKTQEADSLYGAIYQSLKWDQSTIQVYGKKVKIPRLNAWYGDPHCSYTYSGLLLQSLPWTEELAQLREKLETFVKNEGFVWHFNCVLANLYRNGEDSVAWHQDNEPELGQNPVVASISLGETRQFQMKRADDKVAGKFSLDLEHGSLLIMSGKTQKYWLHQLPKSKQVTQSRINLTYRYIAE